MSTTPLPTPIDALRTLYAAVSGGDNEPQAIRIAQRVLEAHTASEWTPDAIRALRQRNAWTQRDLAERLGCHVARVQEWEQGRAAPGGKNRQQLDTLNRQEDHPMTYMIVTQNQAGEWTGTREETAQYIGGTPAENTFATEVDALNTIEQLRAIGPDWAAMDYDIQEITD